MKKYFWTEAEFELPPPETNVCIAEHYSSLYKALDDMLGLCEDDDSDHPLSCRTGPIMEGKEDDSKRD
nr:hypothetical protein [uncultured Desulfobacter sp.]